MATPPTPPPTPDTPTWDTGADFYSNPKARQLPRRPSPLAQEYNTTDFKRWHISAGVVVVDEV
jgi:hypothetical protein